MTAVASFMFDTRSGGASEILVMCSVAGRHGNVQ